MTYPTTERGLLERKATHPATQRGLLVRKATHLVSKVTHPTTKRPASELIASGDLERPASEKSDASGDLDREAC